MTESISGVREFRTELCLDRIYAFDIAKERAFRTASSFFRATEGVIVRPPALDEDIAANPFFVIR